MHFNLHLSCCKGARAVRHLCFGNDLACAAAAACGAVTTLGDAIRAHETAAVRSEAVWALTTLCGADSEVNVKAASRTCFETLESIANDLDPAAPTGKTAGGDGHVPLREDPGLALRRQPLRGRTLT